MPDTSKAALERAKPREPLQPRPAWDGEADRRRDGGGLILKRDPAKGRWCSKGRTHPGPLLALMVVLQISDFRSGGGGIRTLDTPLRGITP